MTNRLIAWLLHLANSDPPVHQSEFYELKKRLLYKHGTYDGDDIQHIVDKCWGYYSHKYDHGEPCGPSCRKCGGTGIFVEKWFVLRRYTWHGYSFHVPNHRLYRAPEYPVTITGKVRHKDYNHMVTGEACLWLYLLCGEWSLFKRLMTGSRVCAWTVMPLLNLQKICMELNLRFKRNRCYSCRRKFWPGKRNWQICRGCRRQQELACDNDDVPF